MVESLFQLSAWASADYIQEHVEVVRTFPSHMKDALYQTLKDRSILSGHVLESLLHPAVKVLDLSHSDLATEDLQMLHCCTQLESLNLRSGWKVERKRSFSSRDLEDLIICLPNLKCLNLRACKMVTDDVVCLIAHTCPNISILDFGDCVDITDIAICALATCTQLRGLNLSGTKVSDDGIICLCNGASRSIIEELILNGCLQITDDSISSIADNCPSMTIVNFTGCPQLTERSRAALDVLLVMRRVKYVSWSVF